MTRAQAVGGLAALALILFGVFMPRDWYDSVPQSLRLPALPIRGVTLLQAAFVLEGLTVLALTRRSSVLEPVPESERWTIGRGAGGDDPVSAGAAVAAVAAITVLGIALRFLGLSSDLWGDEIMSVTTSTSTSVTGLVASYSGSNNHLLNSLLVKLSIALFGQHEWAARLPAALFGAAAIPAFYWVARIALSRAASVAAALLLSVAYHHIFFSQNARGYSAYLFFVLVSCGLLCRALQRDSLRDWLLYIASLVLALASLLNTAFVAGAHLLVVAGGVVWFMTRGKVVPVRLITRLVMVYAAVGLLSFHLYALVLPQAYMDMRAVYAQPSSGYALLSLEFVSEVMRGLSAAIGAAGPLAVPVLAIGALVGAAGLWLLFRTHWLLGALLTVPSILTAAFLLVNGLAASPRFFLMGLFPAILTGVLIMERLSERMWRAKNHPARWRTFAVLVALVAGSASIPLRGYYATPKQSFRASLRYIQSERRPGDVVVSVFLTDGGYKYYGKEFGLNDANMYFARTEEEFDRALAANARDRIFVVTTLHRILGLAQPKLLERIRREWHPVRVFPATIGDGELTVWRASGPDNSR